jgi:nucleotide-binding universal stress UspA family protein
MFKHILVGVDGHDGGRDAIALADRLRESDSAMTLGHAFMAYRDIYANAYEHLQRENALLLLGQARTNAGVEASLECISSRSAGRGLHKLAEREGADLLVVGSSRRGLLGRVLMGDETRAALEGAPCAIAIAPSGHLGGSASIRDIGVGYDGPNESRHAVEFADALAGELGARLSAFSAVAVRTTSFGPGSLPVSDAIDPLIEQALDEIASLGIEARAGYGQAAERLTEYSAGLDLLIIGSRGEGPIGRLVHGSTAHRLADTAQCPLLVLPRAGTRSETPGARDQLSAGTTAPTPR